jgi:hypothetical protein
MVDIGSLQFEPGRFGFLGIRIEIAESEGKNYVRKPGSEVVYVEDDSDGYKCAGCGTEIESLRVKCPIFEGLLREGGPSCYGLYELSLPFCPKCEQEPNPRRIMVLGIGGNS